MSTVRSFRDLIVWQKAMDMVERVYEVSRCYPREEQFGLTSQTRRAATSVPANIAEGHGRGTRASYAAFLGIARGSLRELETHLLLARRLRLTATEPLDAILVDVDAVGRMLHALISRLSAQTPE